MVVPLVMIALISLVFIDICIVCTCLPRVVENVACNMCTCAQMSTMNVSVSIASKATQMSPLDVLFLYFIRLDK